MRFYLKEVESALLRHAKTVPNQIAANYTGGGVSKLIFMGLKVPVQRGVLKAGFSFSHFPQARQKQIWIYIWRHSKYFEPMSLAIEWFTQFKGRPEMCRHWKTISHWQSRVDNWCHADMLCALYSDILEQNPSLVYPTLKKWNGARSSWKRRLSIVSLIYYYNAREKCLPAAKIFPLIRNQLNYPEYYVQKGVGWALREARQAYPKETKAFVKKHLSEISSVAFSATVEKLGAKEKEALKRDRKKMRQKKKNPLRFPK